MRQPPKPDAKILNSLIGKDDLEKIHSTEPKRSYQNDLFARKEQNDIENAELDTKQKQDNLHRQKITYWWILTTVTVWLLMIIGVIFLLGFGIMKNLSDGAVITLFATTTANVIGMLWLVIKYLFKSR